MEKADEPGCRVESKPPVHCGQRRRLSPVKMGISADSPIQKRAKKEHEYKFDPHLKIKPEPTSPGGDSGYEVSCSSSSSTERFRHPVRTSTNAPTYEAGKKKLFITALPTTSTSRCNAFVTSQQIFCFNCKRFGHIRQSCHSRWYHWWPQEYLSCHSWLKRRVSQANYLRRQGRKDEYYCAVKQIEDEVEEAEKKELNRKFNTYRGPPVPQSRRDGQKILHAVRRVTPSPPESPPPRYYNLLPKAEENGGQQYAKYFSQFQKRVESLEKEIASLKLELKKNNSNSPPIFTRKFEDPSKTYTIMY